MGDYWFLCQARAIFDLGGHSNVGDDAKPQLFI